MGVSTPTDAAKASGAEKIRILVIDDSAVMRQLLSAVLSESDDIEVVGTAPDPYVARDKIKRLNPDVLTLDVEMPGMDGLKFLENLMRLRPMPVIMVSSLTRNGASATFRALELGAVDVVAKPEGRIGQNVDLIAEELRQKVRAAARARPHARTTPPTPRGISLSMPSIPRGQSGVVAIGASAGGTQAITEVLLPLPENVPPIVIVQHMPPRFTRYFAERLDTLCAIEVREARDGDVLKPGLALIAPGGLQMELRKHAGGYCVSVQEGDSAWRHRPSVDVLFHSVAEVAGTDALGIILTGMGADGAQGLKAMRDSGAWTVAQDEKTCVIFGMPERAIREGGASEVLGLDRMAERLVAWSAVARGGPKE